MKIGENLLAVVNDEGMNLVDMIEALYLLTEEVGKKYLSPFSPSRLRAMIIYEIYTNSTN